MCVGIMGIACSSCGTRINLSGLSRGSRVNCANCGEIYIVDESDLPPPSPAENSGCLLAFLPCVLLCISFPVAFVNVYSDNRVLFGITMVPLLISPVIAISQLIYGITLSIKKRPQGTIHSLASLVLITLLGISLFLLSQMPAVV